MPPATRPKVLAARARYDRALAATDAALLEAVSPPPGQTAIITNTDHDGLTAGLRAAKPDLDTAQETHRAIPARLPLGQVLSVASFDDGGVAVCEDVLS